MKHIFLLFSLIFCLVYSLNLSASDNVRSVASYIKNSKDFNTYLTSIPDSEKEAEYKNIISNIDTLINQTGFMWASKEEKQKLVLQYTALKRKVELKLKQYTVRQKARNKKIDFKSILAKKETKVTQTGSQTSTSNQNNSNSSGSSKVGNPIVNMSNYITNNDITSNTPATSTWNQQSSSQVSQPGSSTPPAIVTKNNKIIFSNTSFNLGQISIWDSVIGGFIVGTWDNDIRIQRLVFKNIGTANLKDLANTVLPTYMLYSGGDVSATSVIVNDNTIILDHMNHVLPKNKSKSFIIKLPVFTVKDSFWKTVQLTFLPEQSVIVNDLDPEGSGKIDSGNIINNLTFPVTWVYGQSPNLRLEKKSNMNIYNFWASNPNADFDIVLESFKLEISSNEYGNKLNWNLCFRELGSSLPCTSGSTYLTMQFPENSTSFTLNAETSLIPQSNTVLRKEQPRAKYELFLDGNYTDFPPYIKFVELTYRIWDTLYLSKNGIITLVN